jgi:hypothetical protein
MTTEELYSKLGEWNTLTAQLTSLKDQEAKLRKEIFDAAFPTPTEGTNTLDLPEGWKLKGTHKLSRSVDESALPAVLEQLRKKKVDTEPLIKYKPELSISAFRKMNPDHAHILGQALVIKPGMPSMELIAPKS